MPELNALIGENLIRKDSPLAGNEIRFLRKNMGLTGKRLSEIMGVDNVTISRWERDFQQPAKAHDHFIRLLYITEKRVSADQAKQIVESVFPGDKTGNQRYYGHDFESSGVDNPPCMIPIPHCAILIINKSRSDHSGKVVVLSNNLSQVQTDLLQQNSLARN